MKFYKEYCSSCNTETLFLEKLINPCDPNCVEMENVCQLCKTKFSPKKSKNKN